MLVLSRKAGEAIYIGDVVVTVVEISGNKVRLGISAPDSVQIMRDDAKVQRRKEGNGAQGNAAEDAGDDASLSA